MLAKLEKESRIGEDDFDIPTFLRRSRKVRKEAPTHRWGQEQEELTPAKRNR